MGRLQKSIQCVRLAGVLVVSQVVPGSAWAQSETFGDWSVERYVKGTVIATTGNNAGSVFGVICSSKACEAVFNPKLTCEEDVEYPALINSRAGAFSVDLECTKIEDYFVFTLPLEGSVTEAMSVGGELGVAFPMDTGQFHVTRFSLTGSARAAARAAQAAQTTGTPSTRAASDNQTL